MSWSSPIDTTGYDYAQWIQFAFDHPVTEVEWYCTEEMSFACEPQTVLGHYTRLFREPRAILSSYDEARLEQGIWFAVGYQLSEWIWDDAIPIEPRLECIAAMPTMFRDFLVDHALDTACFMWWDMLRNFQDVSDPRVVEAMVNALAEVLRLPARHCRMSALHGLGHLDHPTKERIIVRFLSETAELDDEVRAYAEKAISGRQL